MRVQHKKNILKHIVSWNDQTFVALSTLRKIHLKIEVSGLNTPYLFLFFLHYTEL